MVVWVANLTLEARLAQWLEDGGVVLRRELVGLASSHREDVSGLNTGSGIEEKHLFCQ